MSPASRVWIRVLWMGVLSALLVIFGQVHHDFVYQAF
jgi:hypothetical protein